MNSPRFKVGTVVAFNFQDGAGYMVGRIVGESYEYHAWLGTETTMFTVQPAAGQGLDDPFRVTLDEAFRYGVILPERVLVTDGGIQAAR